MAQLNLEIKLGNDAMRTHRDVSCALTIVASKIGRELDHNMVIGDAGTIFDINGNLVGRWAVSAS